MKRADAGGILKHFTTGTCQLLLCVFVAFISACGAGGGQSPEFLEIPFFFYDVNVMADGKLWVTDARGLLWSSADDGQSWEVHVAAPPNDLRDLTFVDNEFGWCVGDRGTIAHTIDGGETWERQSSPIKETLYSAAFIDRNRGAIVGAKGRILYTTDGGTEWKTAERVTRDDLLSIFFYDADHGWAAGMAGAVFATRDGGQSWEVQDCDPETVFLSIHFVNESVGWVVGGRDIGARASRVSRAQREDDAKGQIVGGRDRDWGRIYKTMDGGDTWDLQKSGIPGFVNSVYFIDELQGWAAGGNDSQGLLYRTKDGGETWEQLENPLFGQFEFVRFVDASNGWATASGAADLDSKNRIIKRAGIRPFTTRSFHGNAILRTTDGGLTWNARAWSPGGVEGLQVIDQDRSWAFRGGLKLGYIVSTKNAGLSWEIQNPSIRGFLTVYFLDDLQGWAGGNGGIIHATIDGGESWVSQSSGVEGAIFSFHFESSKLGWAVGGIIEQGGILTEGFILKTEDGGESWHTVMSQADLWISSIVFANENQGWAAGTRDAGAPTYDSDGRSVGGGIIYSSNDGGKTWTIAIQNLPFTITKIDFFDSMVGCAVGEGGLIVTTNDGGISWQINETRTDSDLWDVQWINAETAMAVGLDGAVVETTNRGKNWRVRDFGTEKHLFSISFSDEKSGWIVSSDGTVWKTRSLLEGPPTKGP